MVFSYKNIIYKFDIKSDYQYIIVMLNENFMMARDNLYDPPDARGIHSGYYLVESK